ncbi:YybH family protein [Carboxylicivirga sp. RSCT41]|uniref:YybH family protein n=1 Tax=Carboxylicivirga agarovorans TaxID=3417570 RepID=UPI003D32A808
MKDLSSVEVDLTSKKEALQETLQKLVEAEIRRDADAAIEFFADSAIVQPSDMPQIQGAKAQYELYKEFFKMPYSSFDSQSTYFELDSTGEMAYDTGWNQFVFPGPDGDMEVKGKYLAVLKFIGDRWKVVALSFNNDQPST